MAGHIKISKLNRMGRWCRKRTCWTGVWSRKLLGMKL